MVEYCVGEVGLLGVKFGLGQVKFLQKRIKKLGLKIGFPDSPGQSLVYSVPSLFLVYSAFW